MSAGMIKVARADRRVVDTVDYLEVELLNTSPSPLGPGGLLMRATTTWDATTAFSASNHWTLAPNATAMTTAILPKDSLKWVEFVCYREADGPEHWLGMRIEFGWLSSKLVAVGADGSR